MSEEIKKENTKSEAALREERIMEFWRENKTFEKSLKKKSPKGHYVFYDGPPFATGQIHYGHILGSTAKDVIGRYKTMQGYYVPRKWGWDCHGLPIENIVEKELGIAGHKEIEKLGIDKFVEYARSKVLQYDKDWEKGIERIGRWVDFKGGYKTMDNTFIESVWWALSEMNKKKLIYEGVRVLAYCSRCETPIANSEIAMDNSYKDISDISVYVKFELEDEPGTSLLAWTTTPWTLPGNTAIAINKNIKYVKIKVGVDILILAEATLKNVLKEKEHTVIGEVKSSELIGKKYKPPFSYYKNFNVAENQNIWKVWDADFVTVEKGTGIAHEAPAFGEDDMNLAKANDIPWIIHVDETGRFKAEVTDFASMQVKPKGEVKDDHQKADIEIIKYLAKNNLLFAKEKILHSYPHCMRCETPIIYYALPSWFINIQKVKKNILKSAKEMNWIPAHLKEGRFKNTAESAPDWNISRNRYWASPLPIWKCNKCEEITFVNSLEDLKKRTKKSGNTYFVMRHGEAENNVKKVYSSDRGINPLTSPGRAEVEAQVSKLKKLNITKIFSSPLIRAKETAEIIAVGVKYKKEEIIFDDRIAELNFGDFSNKPASTYWEFAKTPNRNFQSKIPGGESLEEAKKRIGDFIYEIDKKYKGESILIVTHGIVIELLPTVAQGLSSEDSFKFYHANAAKASSASLHEQNFISLPHNKNYELDLHRPYIDDVSLVCNCGGGLTRIPEVLDCWFESGSMPFAQDHYPFENQKWQKNNFPAGFVAEYIAQTRTWFYYTHVVSAILFGAAPFQNIVTTGTLRAEDGEKMSKSKKNYPDPWIFIDKYGVDALRIYLMSSTLMKGEDANFSEKAVQDIASKIVGRLMNVLAFYELYRDEKLEKGKEVKSKNVLDTWILLRLNQTLSEITKGMDMYDMAEATRPIDALVDDLSTWYLRRSRERIKEGDKEAKQMLFFVLKTMAKILAPFAPFVAEDMWRRLKNKKEEESVHLAQWPKVSKIKDSNTLQNMRIVRDVVSLGLEARQSAKIQVRQPLSKIEINDFGLPEDYFEFIKDELNVKQVIQNKKLSEPILLNLEITDELKQEGNYRELVRALQDLRKKIGLTPSDVVSLVIETNYKGKELVEAFEAEIKKTVLVSKISFKNNNGEEVKIDGHIYKITLKK